MSAHISNVRPDPDKVLVDIADYVSKYKVTSKEAYETARAGLQPPHAFSPCRSSRARISTAERFPAVIFSRQSPSVSNRLSPIDSDHGRRAASSSPADQTSPPRFRIIEMT